MLRVFIQNRSLPLTRWLENYRLIEFDPLDIPFCLQFDAIDIALYLYFENQKIADEYAVEILKAIIKTFDSSPRFHEYKLYFLVKFFSHATVDLMNILLKKAKKKIMEPLDPEDSPFLNV